MATPSGKADSAEAAASASRPVRSGERTERLVYVDGQYYPRNQAKVSVFDHGLLYGDGVFEGIRVYDGYIFELRSHLKRLQDSAKAIALELPMGLDAMERLCYECVEKNGLADGYIRLVVTRGYGDLGIDPRKCKAPTLIVIADQITLYPKESYEKGIEVITSSVRRMNPEALSPNIKSLNYLNNVLAKIEANLRGAGEALMLNREGVVAEAAADNVFVVKDGHVVTPPGSLGALRGVTRRRVMEIARELGYPMRPWMRRVFITGPPGVGKTTVVRRVAEQLRDRNVPVIGFLSEEKRDGGNRTRIGFDLVTLDGARSSMARKGASSAAKVGGYGVLVENVDRAARTMLRQLETRAATSVVILDEVGPMELFSEPFRELVLACLERAPRFLATVQQGSDPLGVLQREDGLVFDVTKTNRDALPAQIADLLA